MAKQRKPKMLEITRINVDKDHIFVYDTDDNIELFHPSELTVRINDLVQNPDNYQLEYPTGRRERGIKPLIVQRKTPKVLKDIYVTILKRNKERGTIWQRGFISLDSLNRYKSTYVGSDSFIEYMRKEGKEYLDLGVYKIKWVGPRSIPSLVDHVQGIIDEGAMKKYNVERVK